MSELLLSTLSGNGHSDSHRLCIKFCSLWSEELLINERSFSLSMFTYSRLYQHRQSTPDHDVHGLSFRAGLSLRKPYNCISLYTRPMSFLEKKISVLTGLTKLHNNGTIRTIQAVRYIQNNMTLLPNQTTKRFSIACITKRTVDLPAD